MGTKALQTLRKNRARYFRIEKAEKVFVPDINENYDNWYYYRNCYYYYKKRNQVWKLLNELLGEELSLYFNLPTIRYKIACENDQISGLVSKDFKKKKLNYNYGTSLPQELFEYIDNILRFNYPSDPKLKEQLTAYLFRGLYSALKDRDNNSMYATDDKHSFILPPSFDYESAFIDQYKHTYSDPIMMISLTHIDEIKQNNPYYEKYLKLVEEIDIEHLFHNISKKKKILIPRESLSYYQKFDEDRKEYLKSSGLN